MIALTMVETIYEVSSFSHGKRYLNDLSDADSMLGYKNVILKVLAN